MSTNISQLCKSWKSAGVALGFRIDTPYISTTIEGREVLCVAHIPDFGSPNGMVVGAVFGPTYNIDTSVKQIAKEQGKYCSFINAKVYEEYDLEVFKEALIDWGFWGIEERRPIWLKSEPHGPTKER